MVIEVGLKGFDNTSDVVAEGDEVGMGGESAGFRVAGNEEELAKLADVDSADAAGTYMWEE